MSPVASVAVIDIGSNSIKVLVASRDAAGNITPLKIRTIDARISAGISNHMPRLSEEGMTRGVDAVGTLLADAASFSPTKIILVATSAVRDAVNGEEFRARVLRATGHQVRILGGEEEANLIGRGLTCDPALRELQEFYVFDLGGGSLECLGFRHRKIEQAVSLQLGCVRLTEKFVIDSTAPFPSAAAAAITDYTQRTVTQSGFRFDLGEGAAVVGTGGTMTTARAILGAREQKPFDATRPTVTVAQLRELLAWLGALPLEERRKIPGLPPARADIFPTALAVLIALADVGRFAEYVNSVYNLRYGLVAEAL
jgi:exopolyphosphatase/guanosine-5'-triphosphate,3'-diphosphate pyrophosphatase